MNDITGTWAVTGAAGAIGTVIRQALRDRGVRLVSLDVRPIKPLGSEDTVVECDVRDLAALTRALEGCAGVIHLGGLADEADFHDITDINIVGTQHVLEAARRVDAQRVVFASSNRVSGFYPSGTRITAAAPPRPDTFYAVSKVAGEALCSLYADKFGLSTIAIRIGSFEANPGDARQQRTWLSHRDAIQAVLAAMTTSAHHAVFYGVSANAAGWWDTGAGLEIGYSPQDDASTLGPLAPIDGTVPQSGAEYTSQAYTLQRMRQ